MRFSVAGVRGRAQTSTRLALRKASSPAAPAWQVMPSSAVGVRLQPWTGKPKAAMLRAMREHVTQNSDYVGRSFAEEARKMHYGESDHRSIYGEADAAEANVAAGDIAQGPLSPRHENAVARFRDLMEDAARG